MTVYVAKPLPSSSKKKPSKTPKYQSVFQKQKEQHKKYLQKHPIEKLYQKPIEVKLPIYVKIFFFLIYFFILIVILLMLNAYLQNQVRRKWWNSNNGKKYKKVFSINLLAQYKSFYLGYKIMNLFMSADVQIPGWGAAEFINNLISAYAKLTPDDNNYFMMPYNVCENIAVGVLSAQQQQEYKNYIFPDKCPFKDAEWRFDNDNLNGWPSDQISWKKLLYIWGIPYSSNEQRGKSGKIDEDAWKTDDNFLYSKYKIPGNTQFIYSFMWGTESGPKDGTLWYPDAFARCVGLNPVTIENVDYSGGWWGLVKYGLGTEKDLSLGLLYNYIYGVYNYKIPGQEDKCSGAQIATASGVALAGGIGAAIGVGVIAGGPFGIAMALTAGLMASAGSLIQGLQGCGTIPK